MQIYFFLIHKQIYFVVFPQIVALLGKNSLFFYKRVFLSELSQLLTMLQSQIKFLYFLFINC
jgi:hypothetical protein